MVAEHRCMNRIRNKHVYNAWWMVNRWMWRENITFDMNIDRTQKFTLIVYFTALQNFCDSKSRRNFVHVEIVSKYSKMVRVLKYVFCICSHKAMIQPEIDYYRLCESFVYAISPSSIQISYTSVFVVCMYVCAHTFNIGLSLSGDENIFVLRYMRMHHAQAQPNRLFILYLVVCTCTVHQNKYAASTWISICSLHPLFVRIDEALFMPKRFA